MTIKRFIILITLVSLFWTETSIFAQTPNEPPPPAEVPPQIAPLAPLKPIQPVQPEKPPQPPTQEGIAQPAEGTIVLNFVDADLKDILQTVGEITGENFMYSPGIGGKITIQTSKSIQTKDVFGIFESILEMNGLAAVKTGPFYKIVASPTARQKSLEILKGRDANALPFGDKIAMHIVPIEFISINDITPIIAPLLSPAGNITPYPKSNILIITDILSNVKKVMDIINIFDVDLFKRMEMYSYTPKNLDIKSLNKELNDLLVALGVERESKQLIFMPLERLNNLLIFAANKQLLNSVKEWIEKLDQPNNSRVYTYYAKNDKAANLKNIIDQLLPKLGLEDVASIKIISYDIANSLIIQASAKDFKTISETLKQFDKPVKQVLIDAVIAEVGLTDKTQFGIQWSIIGAFDNNKVITQQNTGVISATIDTGVSATTTLSSGLSALISDKHKFFAAIQAFTGEDTVNVLSNPHIMVKNNEKAYINVGEDKPIATSTTTSTTTGTTQNIEYRKTGVILTVTPQISEGGTVLLNIKEEVTSSGAGATVAEKSYPSFSTKLAETSVIVSSGQTIIIGGLIKEENTKNYSGIPLLSKIPILGYLFRNTTDKIDKTELVLFITPHVVNSPEEALTVTEEFKKKLVGLKEVLKGKGEKEK
ncbi:MAG: type II secretion system secretin GspD [Deltaproteobacteria bacterium]|nr:type II secretion system secretin GspD [Deltaproteobacteria bacterium]